MNLTVRVREVETPEGHPAFAIIVEDAAGNPIKALKWIDSTDHKPIWISRVEWGWSTMSRAYAEQILAHVS